MASGSTAPSGSGPLSSPTQQQQQQQHQLDDADIHEILATGTDLRQYALDIEYAFSEVERQSIDDYIGESQNIASLHNQIGECDGILERMEDMLVNFQSVLSNISTEITTLQHKSVSMSTQLANRQSIRGQLATFIDDMTVPEQLIATIMDTPATEPAFGEQLAQLNHKLQLVKELAFRDSRSVEDVRDVLDKLRSKAMSKCRAYLLEQVYKFRRPMTNYQVPQNAMMKHKAFFEFLLHNERTVAHEICTEYMDTMSKIYYSYFKSYATRLAQLRFEDALTRDDLMGVQDAVVKSSAVGGGLFGRGATLRNKGTVFTIGGRGEVLNQQLEAAILVPHAQQKRQYAYEALFRSEQYALVDNACREYLFCTEFFQVRGAQAQDLFNQITGRTMTLMIKNVEIYMADSFDIIGMFLCIQLILRYQLMCHKRCVPALDKYWDSLQAVIWPRFELVFRLNTASVRECDPTKFSKELGPHYITRRYAEFSAAIVGISEHFPNQLVAGLLAELQNEVECFILRMAAIFTTRKDQLIYLINNYDLVLGILMEHTRDNSREAEAFREQLSSRSAEYVEEILAPHFGGIIQYVRDAEAAAAAAAATTPASSNAEQVQQKLEKRALPLVTQFSNSWKRALEDLNREVLLSFPSLVTGSSLLQLALARLVQYYHRFHQLLQPAVRAQLTNVHVIMVEIKKYKSNY